MRGTGRSVGWVVVIAVALALVCQAVFAQVQSCLKQTYAVRFVVLDGTSVPGAEEVWAPRLGAAKTEELPLLTADLKPFLAAVQSRRPGWDWSVTMTGAFTCEANTPGEAEFHMAAESGKMAVMKVRAAVAPPASDTTRTETAVISYTLSEGDDGSERAPRAVQSGRVSTLVGMDAEAWTVSDSPDSGARIFIFSTVRGGLWDEQPAIARCTPPAK